MTDSVTPVVAEDSKAKKPKAYKTVTVVPVHGPMHHPFQNVRIEGQTLVTLDNWIEVQIEAGKLTVV